jgi:hypothetical protein
MSKGPEHIDVINKVLNSNEDGKIREFIEKVNTRIDITSQSAGSYWHRSDGTHDARVQGLNELMEDPGSWWRKFLDISRTKKITQIHNLQDVNSSSVGSLSNGHIITQEMKDKARESLEILKKDPNAKIEGIEWATEHGDTMKSGTEQVVKETLKEALSIGNLFKAAKTGAKFGCIFSFGISTIKNSYLIYKNKRTIKKALGNILRDTTSGTTSGAAGSAAGYTTTAIITVLLGTNPVGWTLVATITCSVSIGLITSGIVYKSCDTIWGMIPIES